MRSLLLVFANATAVALAAKVLVDEGASWSDASQTCQQRGGHLASISSQTENDEVAQLCLSSTGSPFMCWIGGRKFDNDLDDLLSGCVDVLGWVDSYGDGCSRYVQYSWCGDPENVNYQNLGFTGDTACCACSTEVTVSGWSWADGSAAPYTNFSPLGGDGQRVGVPSQACLGIWNDDSGHSSLPNPTTGAWEFEPDNNLYPFICEVPAGNSAQPSTGPWIITMTTSQPYTDTTTITTTTAIFPDFNNVDPGIISNAEPVGRVVHVVQAAAMMSVLMWI